MASWTARGPRVSAQWHCRQCARTVDTRGELREHVKAAHPKSARTRAAGPNPESQ